MRTAHAFPLLVVEDDPQDMFLFTRLLKSAGADHPLHIALNGDEAIDLLNRVLRKSGLIDCPGAAFIDARMPKTDGLELLAWIRKRSGLERMPVVMLSHSDDARDVIRAGKLGAQCYFTKYPSLATIARTLEEVKRFGNGSNGTVFEVSNNLLRHRPRGAGGK
jgi:two-component system response regulator